MRTNTNPFLTVIRFGLPTMNTRSTVRLLAILDDATAGHRDQPMILGAFRLLVASEPHRVPALVASLAEGRVNDVIRHLLAYYTAERFNAHLDRVGTTVRSC